MKVVLKSSEADKPNVRGWLKPGIEYVVLSVEAGASGSVVYRIEGENSQTPALFETSLFTIVDGKLPGAWIVMQADELPIQLMPRAWSEDGFWERFFDGDPDVSQCYAAISASIKNEDCVGS